MKFKYSHFSNPSLPYLYHLFIHSFIHFLLFSFFLPSLSYFLLNHVSPSYIYMFFIRVLATIPRTDRFVARIVLPRLAVWQPARHYTMTRRSSGYNVEKQRRREERVSTGGRRTDDRYGMHEVRFLLLLQRELEKPRVYIYIPDQRPGRCGRVSIRLLRD